MPLEKSPIERLRELIAMLFAIKDSAISTPDQKSSLVVNIRVDSINLAVDEAVQVINELIDREDENE